MKIRTALVLMIGSVSLLWLSTPQKAAGQTTPVNENNTSSVKQELEKRFLEYAEALTKRDLTTLDQIWTDDYVFINPRGELVTKGQRLSNLKAGATEFQAVRPKSERMEVQPNYTYRALGGRSIGLVDEERGRASGDKTSRNNF